MTITVAEHACGTHAAYKLTCEDFAALCDANNSACWRCGEGAAALEIDHDHDLGVNAVRGLLCRPCNAHMANVDAGIIHQTPMDQVYLASAWHAGRVIEYMRDQRTPLRSVRVDDELWTKAQAKAALRRETLSAVMKRALVEYVEKHGGSVER